MSIYLNNGKINKPFAYMGSKRLVIDKVLETVQELKEQGATNFYDMFAGSAFVSINVKHKLPDLHVEADFCDKAMKCVFLEDTINITDEILKVKRVLCDALNLPITAKLDTRKMHAEYRAKQKAGEDENNTDWAKIKRAYKTKILNKKYCECCGRLLPKTGEVSEEMYLFYNLFFSIRGGGDSLNVSPPLDKAQDLEQYKRELHKIDVIRHKEFTGEEKRENTIFFLDPPYLNSIRTGAVTGSAIYLEKAPPFTHEHGAKLLELIEDNLGNGNSFFIFGSRGDYLDEFVTGNKRISELYKVEEMDTGKKRNTCGITYKSKEYGYILKPKK